MKANQKPQNNNFAQNVLAIIQNEKPQNTQELVNTIKKRYQLTNKQIEDLLLELEESDKIKFTVERGINDERSSIPTKAWFWVTMALTILTLVTVLIIPTTSFFAIIRSTIGVVFVIFMPGFSFFKTFLPTKIVLDRTNIPLIVETIGLSIGMSLVLVTMLAVLLNFTPWGITPISTAIAIATLTAIFAFTGLIRETSKSKKIEHGRLK